MNHKFRHYWGGNSLPEAVYLSTDGIENCYLFFEKKVRLQKLYCAITEEFSEVGFNKGVQNLMDYMHSELSRSGDDLSIAGIMRKLLP